MSEVRNQLKSQDLDTVEPAAFKNVGGVVYPDNKAKNNLESLNEIVTSFRSVHTPTYGNPIPGSPYGYTDTIDSSTTTKIIETTPNEVISLQNITLFSTETGTTATVVISTDEGQAFMHLPVELTQNKATVMQPDPIVYPLYLVYPQILSVITSSSGTVDTSYMVMTYRTQQ